MAAFGVNSISRRRKRRTDGRIVVSSRVRLARNMRGAKFPDWSSDEELVGMGRFLGDAAVKAGRTVGRDMSFCEVVADDKTGFSNLLLEHGLISPSLLDRGMGSGVVFDDKAGLEADELFSVMVNEEDHFRIQCIRRGYDLDSALKAVDEYDTALNKLVPYAFSRKLGYLTACPSNIGTGMRASVEVALPGLLLLDEFDAVSRAVTRLKFNVRGLAGEGSAVSSGTVQISNGGTLGLSERQAVQALCKVVDEVVAQETNARKYIAAKRPKYFLDYFARALSILQNAYLISGDEAISCLMAVRLGIELGYVRGATLPVVDKLVHGIGHLTIKLLVGGALEDNGKGDAMDESDEIDAMRSSLVSHQLRKAYIEEEPV